MLIDAADLFVGSTFGNVTLTRVKNFKPSDELTREAFIPVGSDRPVGTVKKPGAQFIDLEIMPDTTEEVPWRTLLKTGEEFRFTVQYRGGSKLGPRIQYKVQVAEYNEPDGDQGGDYSHACKLVVIGEGRKLN
jgi:hypothetical protein